MFDVWEVTFFFQYHIHLNAQQSFVSWMSRDNRLIQQYLVSKNTNF